MLIIDCAVECRSQLMSKVTSIWLSGVPVGAEKFRFVFVLLRSTILRLSNDLQVIDNNERRKQESKKEAHVRGPADKVRQIAIHPCRGN